MKVDPDDNRTAGSAEVTFDKNIDVATCSVLEETGNRNIFTFSNIYLFQKKQ